MRNSTWLKIIFYFFINSIYSLVAETSYNRVPLPRQKNQTEPIYFWQKFINLILAFSSFQWSLSDCMSLQISNCLQNILADLNKDIV